MSLYRKYRPRVFADLVGQRHIVTTLRNALAQEKVAHAYLFTGPRGTGKTTTARLLAKSVNCTGDGEKPCGRCEPCRAIDAGRFLDLIEIDAASNNGVDQAREIRDRVGLAPAQGSRKVYIIDEAHMLTNAAFNALLKTLEEPPPHVIFVLATTEPEKIPDTIISRCQRHEFQRVTLQDTVARLAHVAAAEGIAAENEALALIARRATGSLRDALGLLEQASGFGADAITADLLRNMLGLLRVEEISRVVDAFIARDAQAGLKIINALIEKGARPDTLATQVLDYVRTLLLVKHGQSDPALGETVMAQAAAQADRIETADILHWLDALNEAVQPVSHAVAIPQLALEVAVTKIALGVTPAPAAVIVENAAPSATPPPVRKSTSAPTPLRPVPIPAQPEPDVPPVALTVADIRARWKDVLTHARRVDRTMEALLRSCEAVAVSDDTITLAVKYDFHMRKLTEAPMLKQAAATLTAATGKSVTVSVVLKTRWLVREQTAGWQDRELAEIVATDPLVQESVALGGRLREPVDA